MKKKTNAKIKVSGLVAIIALFLLVSLSGCGGGNQSPPDELPSDYRKGTGSLKVNFGPNAPARTLYEDEKSLLVLQLENTGGYNVTEGVLAFIFDRSVFQLSSSSDRQGTLAVSNIDSESLYDIAGKSIQNPRGEEKILSYTLLPYKLRKESQVRTSQIVVKACYNYQTVAVDFVCVDPYSYVQTETKKRCEMQKVSVGATGSPVIVDSIEPTIYPIQGSDKAITGSLAIEVKSNDVVFLPGMYQRACGVDTYDVKTADVSSFMDKAVATVYFSDKILTDCDGKQITFREGVARFTCSLDATYSDATYEYEAPVRVELNYGLMQTISKTVDIKSHIEK